MDRIDSIVRTIERNSKLMKEYNLRIQELKDKLDSIDSQIKWAPHAALDDKMEKDAYYARSAINEADLVSAIIARENPYQAANAGVVASRIEKLEKERVPIQNELDYLLLEKERLRQQNIQLRLEAQEIKKTV